MTRKRARTVEECLDAAPASNLLAERSLLGAGLFDPSLWDELALVLEAEEFHGQANAALYRAAQRINGLGRSVDPTLLLAELDASPDDLAAFAVGDSDGSQEAAAYIATLVSEGPLVVNALAYAQVVQDRSTIRRLREVGASLLASSADPATDPSEALHQCEAEVFRLLGQRQRGEVRRIDQVLLEVYEAVASGGRSVGLDVGLADVQNLTGGLRPGELTILAARPSVGKSSMALGIAGHVARAGGRVYYVSLEMSRQELSMRLLSACSGVAGHRIRDGFTNPAERSRLVEAANRLSRDPLWLDDTPQRTMLEISAASRRLKRQGGLALVVVDYLQLVTPVEGDRREEQVAAVARRMKALARELSVPVLCCAQLNRQADTKGDDRPRLSHLRESGAIEQDADVVLLLYRAGLYAPTDAPDGVTEINVAKQRNGPVGTVKVLWRPATTEFVNLAPRPEEF